MIPANLKTRVDFKHPVEQLHSDQKTTDPDAQADCLAGAEDDDWLLRDVAATNDSRKARKQFALICDNVQLDVASHRSLLGDLGRILHNVLGLAAAVTHRTDYRASSGVRDSRCDSHTG